MAMREIKFRAWEESLDYMHKGSEHFSMCLDKEGELSHPDIIFMQYTGLKDKNGVEIYEGDILYCKYQNYKGSVFFDNGSFKTDALGFGKDFIGNSEDFEVIGNIYENGDLLEQ